MKRRVKQLRDSKHVNRIAEFLKQHKRTILIVVGVLLAVVVAVQLLYPRERTLPFATIGGDSAGGQSREFVALALTKSFEDYQMVYRLGDETAERAPRDMGATLQSDEMLKRAVDYPFVYRLIPFSILWYRTMPSDFRVEWNQAVLDKASTELADELSVESVDASIAIEPSGETKVTTASDGVTIAADVIAKKTREAALPIAQNSEQVSFEGSVTKPSVSDEDVRTIQQTIESVLDTGLSIAVEDRAVVQPTASDIAKWITVAKTDDGAVTLEANEAAIKTYIAGLSNEYGTRPTATIVTLVDGVETGRKPGVAGLGIDSPALTAQLAEVVTKPSTTESVVVTAVFAPISPPIKRNASYTSSLAGLRAYVDDMAREGNIKISVRQLGGNGWSAGGREADSVTAASTYKPYVFLRVFDDINDGTIKWSDKINGVTYAQCLEDTIVISANECPMALIEKYDKFKLTSYLRTKGFSAGTGFTFKEVTQTTAGDLTKLMAGIEQGKLVKGDNRDRLLNAMSRQIHRQGIPAGTSASVYNKPGFLWEFLNDAAIVRHPQGTYVLAIMTEGESWGKIAEITRKIESILYG